VLDSEVAGGDGRMDGNARDDEGEEQEEEGTSFDIPEVSASSIVERSAEMGGPGESARRTGAVIPTLRVNK